MGAPRYFGGMEIRAGALGSEADRCVDLWLEALAARDGIGESLAVGVRAREKFTRQIVRFAVLGREVNGFALTVDGGECVARLAMLALQPHKSSQGGGRALLADALLRASEAGYRRFELQVREGNTKAIRLYESAGLTQVGLREDHPLGGLPMLTFACCLV